MLRPNSSRPSSLARLRRRKRRRRKRLRQVQHQHPAHRKNRRHNKPRLVERRCPDGPAASRRPGPSTRPTPSWIGDALSSAMLMGRRSLTSISRGSWSIARRRISSPATKRGASPPTSPSCRGCCGERKQGPPARAAASAMPIDYRDGLSPCLTSKEETDITTIIQRRPQHPRRTGRDQSEQLVAIRRN
jgi:hypothetical protein